ncbi:2-methylcitrate dehydratase, partial [Pseudomonas aeruginosa]
RAAQAVGGEIGGEQPVGGLSGARHILDGEQGMAAGMSSHPDPDRLVDRPGRPSPLLEPPLNFPAPSRHPHPAADAL